MSTTMVSRRTSSPHTYPTNRPSPIQCLFGVVTQTRSYRNLAYVLLGIPLGITWFTVLISRSDVAISVVVALLGNPMLLGLWYMTRSFANEERTSANVLLGQHLARAPMTFLFTDIEGSTRRWQDDPEGMRALLVEHDAVLRDVVDKHCGYVFKHTGDGVAAVFASASDAVKAAVDAQLRLRDVLPVRMGLHTGEAELRDGDYFGATLSRCARLMGIAHGGQVVVSAVVAALVREQAAIVDLGEHRLRDLSYPEHVWQVGVGEFAPLRSLENLPTSLPL